MGSRWCLCGWGDLGKSHAAHVADAYEAAAGTFMGAGEVGSVTGFRREWEIEWEAADEAQRRALWAAIRRELLSARLTICRACGSRFPDRHRCHATAVRR
jgi:hypothetical protein